MKWNMLYASVAFAGFSLVDSLGLEPEFQVRLAASGAATGQDYVKLRDVLVSEVSTNSLMEAANSVELDWRERLIARIVLERKLRGLDIQRLRRYDWQLDVEFNQVWAGMHSGMAGHMTPLAVKRFEQSGLWYFYIEQNWKNTGEIGVHFDIKKMAEAWPFYASGALAAAPESWYLGRVQADFITQEGTARGKRYFRRLYSAMLKARKSDAFPALLDAFDSYFVSIVGNSGVEAFPGSRDITYRSTFDLLLSFADVRHADILVAYMAERPVLEPLQKKLAEVRARPAPEPVPEPPFRLMPTPEFLKTGPLLPEREKENP